MKGVSAVAGLGVTLAVTGWLLLAQASPAETAVLEVDLAEHLATSLDRSTYDLSGSRLMNGEPTQFLLWGYQSGQPPFEARLRDGDKVLTFPVLPMGGNLYVQGSLVEALDLTFYNFADARPDQRADFWSGSDPIGDRVTTAPEDDLTYILDSYDRVAAQGWQSFPGACFHNRIPGEGTFECPERFVHDPATGRPDQMLTDYVAQVRAARAADDHDALDQLGPAVLGGWWLEDGTVLRLTVSHRTEADLDGSPISEKPFNLELVVTANSLISALKALAVRQCYSKGLGGGPRGTSEVRSYTPEAARLVYGGLYDALGAPQLGDALIAQPVEQETFARGVLRLPESEFDSSTYFTARAWDRHYDQPREPGGAMRGRLTLCDLVPELEAEAGVEN
jgi:hypothetical protein